MLTQAITFLISILILSSCQNLQTRHQSTAQGQNQSPVILAPVEGIPQPAVDSSNANQPLVIAPNSSVTPVPDIPKIGLILGPGGARAYAHIALLHELQKSKIPIHSVGGLEFGAPMAALYSWKGFANDVEWQMMKLKTEDFGKKWVDIAQVQPFLNMVFQQTKVEEMKLPFACLAHNLNKNQLYVMSRGVTKQLLPYCWPYPPVMKPYSFNVSGLRDPKLLADYLRSQGANYIVYVNVLAGSGQNPLIGDRGSFENIMWQEIATSVSKNPIGIDYVINLNLGNYGILAFDKKRDILQKGAEVSLPAVQQLAKKIDL